MSEQKRSNVSVVKKFIPDLTKEEWAALTPQDRRELAEEARKVK